MALLAWVLPIACATSALGQFRQSDSDGAKLGEALVQRWRAGVVVHAAGGPCTGIVGYVPVPIDWPEQQVSIDVAAETVSSRAGTMKGHIPDGTKQQLLGGNWNATAALLEAGDAIEATAQRLPYVSGY